MSFSGNTDKDSARYWDDLAGLYQRKTRISTNDFHYGPLLPGDSRLHLLPVFSEAAADNKSPISFDSLEIGCGAGQNSIFLAKQGVRCVAIDLSDRQLAHGRKLSTAEKVDVDFRCVSMDTMGDLGRFDLIHSTYALPFSADPRRVIEAVATMLRPGGTFLLTTGHPLHAGEWLEVGDDEDGIFLPNYFCPPPDVRMSLDDKARIATQYWPLSEIADWIHDAGLLIERLLEPVPLPIPEMSEAEILKTVPYDSPDWRELYPQLARIPVVAIFKCVTKRTTTL